MIRTPVHYEEANVMTTGRKAEEEAEKEVRRARAVLHQSGLTAAACQLGSVANCAAFRPTRVAGAPADAFSQASHALAETSDCLEGGDCCWLQLVRRVGNWPRRDRRTAM